MTHNTPSKIFSSPFGLNWLNRFGPIIALAILYAALVIFGPASFATFRTAETIIRQTAIVGAAAMGMTLVIIAGGIDLSAGSMVAFCTVIAAKIMTALAAYGQPEGFNPLAANVGIAVAAAAALSGIGAAGLCGYLNGLVITRFKVVPFIVTLGTLLIIRGATKGLANQQKVDAPLSPLNALLAPTSAQTVFSALAPGVWLLIGLALAVYILLHYTRLGRHIYAVGSNEQAARLCGVNVEKVKRIVYTLSGLSAGLAGVLQFSRLSVGDPTVAVGLELDVIAAVVIGGGSLAGGQGTVIGSLVGALMMTVIKAGCSQMGLPNWIQEIVTGLIIVLAVGLDRLRQRWDK